MNKRRMRTASAFIGIAAIAAATLTACSSGSSTPDAATGPVNLTFVNWDGGMQAPVDQWNKENPKIQIKLIKPSGTGYTLYNKLITNNKAGTNPDITEVEYQALPALIANKVVVPIGDDVGDALSKYPKSSLQQVSFAGKVYGVPQNVCPMMFFYRKDIWDKFGLTAPKTWDEYAADAAIIKKKDPSKSIGNFSAADAGWFAGLAQQAGANWWTTKGDDWTVGINDAASKKVADFWGNLTSKGLVDPNPNWSAQWNTNMNNGTLIGWVSAQWAPNQLPSISKEGQGKWVAAPLPQWSASDNTVGIWGGEAEAVTANSKHPKEAAKFVAWLNSSDAGITSLVKNVQVYPAATSGQALSVLDTPPAYMSNQPDYNTLVKGQAADARSFEIWGPNANVTFDSYSNEFAAALQNKTSLSAALDGVQKATVDDMKKLGFKVTQ
jgi:multiple sugar transport system substrate-binding protein